MNVELHTLRDTLEQTLGWSDIELTQMQGATSAMLFRATSGEDEAVVRLFDAERWEENVAELSAREANILNALAGTRLPAPACLATLPDNGVVMSLMPGEVWLPQTPEESWLAAHARMLTRIHETRCQLSWRYDSWNSVQPDALAPDWWPDEILWRAALAILDNEPTAPEVLVHRDFHPLNLLWQAQRISAVVDWINACTGPAAVDVAHCRLNLAIMYGMPAADRFLELYQSLNPDWRYHPYWDLDDAFSGLPDPKPYPPWTTFGLSGITRQTVRKRLLAFITSAVENA
jgi:Ser/Thr protein kinase RdoA (MazF antagonist)